MIFTNLSVAVLGGLLLAIPIVLHLVMKRQPKPLIFPAVRFIRKRSEDNRRKLQLKNLLLLALRCGAILAAGFALARPAAASAAMSSWLFAALAGCGCGLVLILAGVAAARKVGRAVVVGLLAAAGFLLLVTGGLAYAALTQGKGKLIGGEETPVAAAVVIDVSPRMLYRRQNQTRLEAAQEMARSLIGQFPRDSQIGLVDSHGGGAVLAADLTAARASVDRLRVAYAPQPLSSLLETAISLVRTSELPRKEVYVVTDLSKAAWDFETQAIQQKLAEAGELQIYVIDVGADDPRNVWLGELSLSAQSLARNSTLSIETEVRSLGSAGGRLVELYLEEPDPQRPTIRDGKPLLPEARKKLQEAVTLEENGGQRVRFDLKGLPPGTHQGFVRIDGEDGMPLDDTRYFTVEVRPPLKVLVAAPPDTPTEFLTEALAPLEFRKSQQARFECTVIPLAQLPAQELRPFAAVCLLDPAPLPAATWLSLAEYVKEGGGLAVFLGPQAQPAAAFNEPEPQQLLPGKLLTQSRPPESVYLAPRTLAHPLLARFRPIETSLPWQDFPIQRYWALKAPPSGTVIAFSNGRPALIEKPLGAGRVLTFTTPFSEPAQPVGRDPWNQLVSGFEPWPYVMLVNEMLLYLADSGAARLNYLAGDPVELPNPSEQFPSRYQLFTPQSLDQDVAAGGGKLSLRFADAPGAYRLKGRLKENVVVRGFCLNLPPASTLLARAEKERLDEVFGAGRYQLAKSREEMQREMGVARSGREFFPYLLVGFALLLGLEYLLANRFYRGQGAIRPTAAALARETAQTA